MKKILLATLLFLSACSELPDEYHENPPKLYFTTNTDRFVAEIKQIQVHPEYMLFRIADTHSMEPFLDKTMDVIMDPDFPFEDLKVDDIILYDAVWRPKGSQPICHRVNALDHNTLIVSGDNNAHYERGIYGVTKENYRGKVVLVMVLSK